MARFYSVHIACNDPDNGTFARKAQAIQLHFGQGDYLELGMCGRREPGFLVDKARFRLGRFFYPYETSRYGVGNWCWNAYEMHPINASRLVFNLMRDSRWACEGGLVEACDAWDAKDNGAFMRVWRNSLWPPEPIMLVGSSNPDKIGSADE